MIVKYVTGLFHHLVLMTNNQENLNCNFKKRINIGLNNIEDLVCVKGFICLNYD